jgi:hypothetical protein
MNSIIDTIKAVIANLLPRRLHEALEHLEPVSEDASAEFLNEQEQAALKTIINAGKTQRRHVMRARLLLTFNSVNNVSKTADIHQTDRKVVRKWRQRWEQARPYLRQIAQQKATFGSRVYREAVKAALDDAPREGAPDTFTPEQRVQIVAMACEVLDDQDSSPLSHWTHQQLADEAVRRKIVPRISSSTVGRILQEAHLKPHRSRYWMTSPDQNTPEFTHRAKTICELYAQAQNLHQQGVHVLSTDEKTGIQAIERDHPTLPAQPGPTHEGLERREHNYQRHGTLCLIANFHVATGKILSPTLSATRTEQDFLQHIQNTVAQDPDGQWIFIVDQLNTHMSESLVLWVADALGLELSEQALGKKGRCGVLESMPTRRAFLEDASHRIRFVYTPRHASWLNQVELWFSILTRRLLKRGSFDSVQTLQERIERFIEFFNNTMAKPFKWTYSGHALAA